MSESKSPSLDIWSLGQWHPKDVSTRVPTQITCRIIKERVAAQGRDEPASASLRGRPSRGAEKYSHKGPLRLGVMSPASGAVALLRSRLAGTPGQAAHYRGSGRPVNVRARC